MSSTVKVNSTALAYIENVVRTAHLVKIDSIIIEPGKVRGMDEDKTVFMFQTENVPTMPFGSIALNRTDVFTSRLDVARTAENIDIEAEVVETVDKQTKDEVSYAKALTFKAKGIKIDYRCANPLIVKAPRVVHDNTAQFVTHMTPEALLMISKGASAMGSDEIVLIGGEGGVAFEIRDGNGDVFSYQITDKFTVVDKSISEEFEHTYPIKTLLPLFKVNAECDFAITSQGTLKIEVNGLGIIVLPRT